MSWAGLHLDEQTVKELVFSLPMPAFVKDTSSRFVVCNRAFADYAHEDPDDMVGKSDADMPWADHGAATYRDWDRRIIERGESELEIVETIRTASGIVRAIETDKFPLRDTDGTIVGLLGRIHDRGLQERAKLDNEDMVLRYVAGESVSLIAETSGVSPSEVYAALRGQKYVATWQTNPTSWSRYPVFLGAVRNCRLALIRDELQLETYAEFGDEYAADLAFIQRQIDALNRAIAESDIETVRGIVAEHTQNRVRELRKLMMPAAAPDDFGAAPELATKYSPSVMYRRYAAELERLETDSIRIDRELQGRVLPQA